MEMIRALPSISSINTHLSRGPNYCRMIPGKSLFGDKSSCRSRSLSFSGNLSFHGSGFCKPAPQAISQVESSSWVDVYLPEAARPYARLARLEKPYGIFFITWPCLWSIALAARAGGLPDPSMLALFLYYGFVLRSFICTLNDIIDHDLDAQVERTKSRPLPSGEVTLQEALVFLAFQLFLASGIYFPLNNLSRGLALANYFIHIMYPFMKRLTYWPQMYLGVCASFGILTAWAAAKQNLDLPIVLPLCFSCVLWTMFVDTIYAHQDKADDIKAGIKSTAIRFGSQTKPWISGFAITSIASLALSGYNAQLGWPFYAILVAIAGHFTWQISTLDLSDLDDCRRKFVSNQYTGGIVFAGLLLGRLVTTS